MKQVTIRELRANLSKLLEEKELLLTKNGKPYKVIIDYKSVHNSPEVVVTSPTAQKKDLSDDFHCVHGITFDQRCVTCELEKV